MVTRSRANEPRPLSVPKLEREGRGEGVVSYRVGIEEDARERVVQIAPGGDEHGTCGWRQTGVADDLQEGESEPATG